MRWQLHVLLLNTHTHTDFQSSCSSGPYGLQIGVLFSQDLFNSPSQSRCRTIPVLIQCHLSYGRQKHTHQVLLSGLARMWREGSGLDLVRPTLKQRNAGMLNPFPTDPARTDVTNDDLKARRHPIKQATFLKFLPFLF